MMVVESKIFIFIFFLFHLLLLSLGCGPTFWRDPDINHDHLKWIVEIFSLPANSSDSENAIFQCSGILIHPQAVLTTRKCMPKDYFSRNITVRAYSWSEKESTKMVQELYVSRSFYQFVYDPEIFGANLTLFTTLIMEKEFDIGPMISITDSYKINTDISSSCIYVDIQAKQSHVLTRELSWTYHLSKDQCCDIFGDWTIPIENKTLLYHCKNHPSSFCANSYSDKCPYQGQLGSPLYCLSKNDGYTYIIAGLLIDNAWCHYHFAKIEDVRAYIKDALANITSSK